MYFKIAPWSRGLHLITWTSLITLLILYPLLLFIDGDTSGNDDLVVNLSFAGLYILFVIIYILGPKGYLISSEGIEIKKTFGSILISGKEIKDVQVVSKPNLSRLIGNGGFFSYYGTFCEMNGEKVKVYCTRFDQMVRVKTTALTYYLSPEDPKDFAVGLSQILKQEVNN